MTDKESFQDAQFLAWIAWARNDESFWAAAMKCLKQAYEVK